MPPVRKAGSILWILVVLLDGCVSPPPALRQPGVETLTLSQVLEDPKPYRDRKVRWGGLILTVENEARETWVQLLAKPLDRRGRPREDAEPLGRFLAHTRQFLDPAIYARGRELTVTGRLAGTAERRVGKRQITLPVVAMTGWHLWPERKIPTYPPFYPYYRWYPSFWWYYPWWPVCGPYSWC